MPEGRRISPAQLFRLPVISGAACDRDGRRVAYVRTLPDEAANAYRGSVRIHDIESGSTAVLTRGGARDASPAWSPDGARVFFASDRNGTMQVWCIECAGGEPYALPAVDGSVSEFAVAPNGRFVAAVATSQRGAREVEARGWRRIARQRYRADGIGYHDCYPQIWLIDLEQGSSRALTDGSGFVAGVAWSPDSTRLAYAGEHGVDADAIALRELWSCDLGEGNAPRQVLSMRAVVLGPAWSPDGARIAFIGSDDPHAAYGLANTRLFSVSPSEGNPQCLTPTAEWTCGDFTATDTGGAGAPSSVQWWADGSIALLGTHRGATRVFVVGPDLRARDATGDALSATHFSAAAGGRIVCCASDSATPPELYAIPDAGAARRLTFETKEWCEQAGVKRAARLDVKGKAGPIEAWHLHGDGPTLRPGVLEIHGGPHFAYANAFFFEFQLLAAAGYDVVYCNPRGSQGYGEAFASAITGDWAAPALEDCLASLDAAMADGGIAPKRLGVAGGSYGGYMSAWTVGHTDRFAAAVVMRAAINLESLWGTSEVGRMLNAELGGTPAQIPDVYRRCSPLTYADAVTTPVLITHGERDYRCPIEQAEQFFTALVQRGKPVEFMRFTEADHGLSRGGPPRQRVARLEAILDWFDRFLR
jgi:dipeptidyl aminopeptidase/acylaminoacyl peptidase